MKNLHKKAFRLVNTQEIFYPFISYEKTDLFGSLQIFKDNDWISVYYLQDKIVRQICSFFYRNFGTISVIEYLNNVKKIEVMETMDCPVNATNLQLCKFYGKT